MKEDSKESKKESVNINEDLLTKKEYFELYEDNAIENCCCDCDETHYEGDGYNEPRYKTCYYDGHYDLCPYVVNWLEDKYEDYLLKENK